MLFWSGTVQLNSFQSHHLSSCVVTRPFWTLTVCGVQHGFPGRAGWSWVVGTVLARWEEELLTNELANAAGKIIIVFNTRVRVDVTPEGRLWKAGVLVTIRKDDFYIIFQHISGHNTQKYTCRNLWDDPSVCIKYVLTLIDADLCSAEWIQGASTAATLGLWVWMNPCMLSKCWFNRRFFSISAFQCGNLSG